MVALCFQLLYLEIQFHLDANRLLVCRSYMVVQHVPTRQRLFFFASSLVILPNCA